MSYGRMLRVWLVALLVLPLIAPISGWSTSLSMGTVRGIRAAELSLDDGKNWLPLGSRSLPVLEGTQLRTSNGGAVVDLSDGSRLNVMPFSLLRFRDASGRTRVSLVHGRMTFLLPRDTRVEISSSTARLESVRSDVMQGEFFVTREGTMGLRMSAGNLEVHELAGSRQVRLASIEPVFLPKRPPGAALLFTSSVAPTSPPSGSKPVFDPRGESLGYLRPDAQLVVQPGYTSNLTRPFPPKLVQFAMAKIDERNREDAVPVFDVNGGYVGYLAGPVFYAEGPQVAQPQDAQTEIAQGVGAGAGASGAGTFLGANATSVLAAGGSVLAVAGGAAGGAVSSASSSASAAPTAATPIEPIRQ